MWDVQGTRAIHIDIAWLVVTFLFVSLRVYVQAYKLRSFALSDTLIILAWFCFLGDVINDYLTYRYGLWDPRLKYGADGTLPDFNGIMKDHDRIRESLKLMYAIQPLYFIELYSIKVAFLLLYQQLFPPNMVNLRRAMYGTLALVVLGGITVLLLNMFWCEPIRRNWTLAQEDRCLSWAAVPVYFFSTGMNIFTDILVYTLPFFLLPRLYATASRAKMLGIVILFSLGLLCIVCTVCRISAAGQEADAGTVAIWFSAEQAVAIIVACCPPLKWLWSYSRLRSSTPCSVFLSRSRKTGGGSKSGAKMELDEGVIPATRWNATEASLGISGIGSTYRGTRNDTITDPADEAEQGLAPRRSSKDDEENCIYPEKFDNGCNGHRKSSAGQVWTKLKHKMAAPIAGASNATFGGRSQATFGGRSQATFGAGISRKGTQLGTTVSRTELERYELEFGSTEGCPQRPPSLAITRNRNSVSAGFGFLSDMGGQGACRESGTTMASSQVEQESSTSPVLEAADSSFRRNDEGDKSNARISVGSITFGRRY